MKKSLIICCLLIIALALINLVSALRINEVELNPKDDCRDCTEWVELYSETSVDLTGWKIVNYDNDELNLSGSVNGYLIVSLPGQWLDNSNESVRLYNGNSLIDSTIIFADSYNDNRTWQYCNEWVFKTSTKNIANMCNNPVNQTQNNTQIQQNNTQNNTNQKYDEELEIDWDKANIINGDEFEIDVKAFNLKNQKYDLKVDIRFEENDTIISDRYDEQNNEWKSGLYYVSVFFEGPGDETGTIKLRIRDFYKKFSGDAVIYAKLRNSVEINEDIEILEQEESSGSDNSDNSTTMTNEEYFEYISKKAQELKSQDVIYLNKKTEDLKNNNVFYESATEKMKKYAIYFFAVICVFFIGFLLFRKKK